MLNLDGTLVNSEQAHLHADNRGLEYGDAIFETIKYARGGLLFWEEHYFRLMASMRILRMEIPMSFTLEFLEAEVLRTLEVNQLTASPCRVKILVFRKSGGLYSPETRDISYMIKVSKLDSLTYKLNSNPYVVDLYKDFYVATGLLSGLKTNNKVLNVLGSIYAQENGFDNCLILNTDKSVIEGLSANLFLVKDKKIKTPPLTDGCLRGIMRNQIIEIIRKMDDLEIEESSISPFELQKADELFLTNVITGIQPISNYRKKEYKSEVAQLLIKELNKSILI